MDNVPTAAVGFSGSFTEASSSPAHEEDVRHGHSVLTGSQPPKQVAMLSATLSLDNTMRDGKGAATHFHGECQEVESTHAPRLRSSRMFKGKGIDAIAMERERKRPLQLLDLPVDILKEIVREVTHTNDLTSLALCHSALHRLAIPHIYSRFDIVWPDNTANTEQRSGVDALTYGLATLVMAEEIFGEAPGQNLQPPQNRFNQLGRGLATDAQIRRRRGNHYAQYTKKFSLGNGPTDWVQEYLISKEGGKMLGTLVALAIARMRSLEAFIWDMPTGILQDVWNSLASLGDRRGPNDQTCRLEKVWVRWHDNALDNVNMQPSPPAMNLAAVPSHASQGTAIHTSSSPIQPGSLERVERPSFSQLPPLTSLSVLDIDELAYLDEMAVLIGNSVDKLRELRVGIARHAMTRDWVTVREDDNLQQVDPKYPTAGSVTIGEKRLGGIIGTLTGFVCDMRQPRLVVPKRSRQRRASSKASLNNANAEGTAAASRANEAADQSAEATTAPAEATPGSPTEQPGSALDSTPTSPEREAITEPATDRGTALSAVPPSRSPETEDESFTTEPQLGNTLRLESLELERVPLSVPILRKAIDWTRITSLTLLNCLHHEQLWKVLRKDFPPIPELAAYSQPRRIANTIPRKNSRTTTTSPESVYPLKLKKIHTSTVSSALVSFLKESLAPDSLEVLFLQEARSYTSTVDMSAIYRGPIRRHRASLRKLIIDSSEKAPDGNPVGSSRWRRWMFKGEILTFICSGKMPQLRELGMALSYQDWHYFLQHLPCIPQLRSVYIPFLADHPAGTAVDPRDIADYMVTTVALRPEVELCYMGIANKCFEILENQQSASPSRSSSSAEEAQLDGVAASEDEDVDDDEGLDEEEEGDTESDASEDDGSQEDDEDEDPDGQDDISSEEGDADDKVVPRVRLREILFYDDKVAIFKARHGKL